MWWQCPQKYGSDNAQQAMMTLQGMAELRFPSVHFIYQCMSPPCQFYNTGFTYFYLHYIITMLKSFNIKKSTLCFRSYLLGPYLIRCMCTLLGALPYKHVYHVLKQNKVNQAMIYLWPSLPFSAMTNCTHLCKGMAGLPFQKL